MTISRWIGITWLFFVLVEVVGFLYVKYKYPVCSDCKDNLYSKRVKGKIICQIHGKV